MTVADIVDDIVKKLWLMSADSDGVNPRAAQIVMAEAADEITRLRATPEITDENMTALIEEIGSICTKHLRAYQGFTFHPCYIDKSATDPLRAALTAALSHREKLK